ncbi:MAG: branched chain amino acid aminotransferase, partial [Thiotrichaceae bacterium]
MQTMADRDGVIWFDGEMVDWRDAKIHVLTHTLHYGMGVFEGLRAYKAEQGTAVFRLQAHTDRLFESAAHMNMSIPFDKETLNVAQMSAVRENNLESAYIRPMCFYGSEGMGLRADNLRVHVMIAAWEWGAYLGQEALDNGIRIRKSSFVKNDSHPSMYLAKANGNYINSMLALDEAMSKGYDEALLLDSKGNVAEGSGENIFMINDGVLYTPELTASLNGITRNTIMTLAKESGYDVVETTIKIEQLYDADEVFFTGSAAEVTPIREI